MQLLSWLQALRRAFGTPFLLLVFSVYWTQGFRSFPWIGINFLMKDVLKLGPAAAQLMTSTAYIPWSVKPIYGILSDCIPIGGQRRVPYIVVANLMSLLPWMLMAALPAATSSASVLTAMLVVQNIGAAMADVVVDAMVAESTNKDREVFAGDLQALSWFSMAVGGILGSLLGGPALKSLKPQAMFGLFSVCPLAQLLVCFLTKERSLVSDTLGDELRQEERMRGEKDEERVKCMDPPTAGPHPHPQNGHRREEAGAPLSPAHDAHGSEVDNRRIPLESLGPQRRRPGLAGKEAPERPPLVMLESLRKTESDPGCTGVKEEPLAWGAHPASTMPMEQSRDTASGRKKGENNVEAVIMTAPEETEAYSQVMLQGAASQPGRAAPREGLRRRSVVLKEEKEDGAECARMGTRKGKSEKGETGSDDKLGGGVQLLSGRELDRLRRKLVFVVGSLWHAVLNPDIHRPMLWFMASCALIPSLQTTMFYYQTNVLHLDVSFLGTARVVGWAGLMLGTLVYNARLKYVPMRKIFRWVHVTMALLTLTDTLLTSRFSLWLGIPDKVFVLGASALGDALSQFRFMPFLILSARLCPPGIEGTLFALFMSAYNFGNTLSGYMGATLASRLGITSSSFSNLTLAVAIQSFCTILPIFLLAFVPANVSGSGEEKQVVREVIISDAGQTEVQDKEPREGRADVNKEPSTSTRKLLKVS